MASELKFDDKNFNDKINEVSRHTERTTQDNILVMGTDVVKAVVKATPKKFGFLRAGWSPAWDDLRVKGRPSRRRVGETITRPRRRGRRDNAKYTPEGTITKDVKRKNPYIVMENDTTKIYMKSLLKSRAKRSAENRKTQGHQRW